MFNQSATSVACLSAVDLRTRSVRVRAVYVERSTGEIVLGPPKSRAGRRIVDIPAAIIPVLREHLAAFVADEPGALVFPGQMGGPLRRGNFNKMSGWPHAAQAIGMEGLHFHDLRHAGNHFAAASGAGLKDLMARMGHDSERAALIYQHQARGARQADHRCDRPSRPGRARQRQCRRRPGRDTGTRRLMAR